MREYEVLVVSDSIIEVKANSPEQARHVALESLKQYPNHLRVAEIWPKGEERRSFPADIHNPPPLAPTPTSGNVA